MEFWRVIKKFPKYEVSNYGKVRNIKSGHIKKMRVDTTGYYTTTLCDNNYPVKQKAVRLHVILCDTFLKKPKKAQCVNHKDGNKLNNRLSNLEWTTYKENTKHAVRIGIFSNGSKNGRAKLTQTEVDDIRWLSLFVSNVALADAYGVSTSTICDIKMKRTWK